jgi:hypothetical protein
LGQGFVRAALSAAGVAVCLGCSGRQPELVCMNELDIPGQCPAKGSPPPPLQVVTTDDSLAGHVWGTVLDSEVGAPVAFAEVRVVTLPGVQTTADSLGRFRLSIPAASRQILRIAMIGYQSRADTIEMPRERAVLIEASLNPQPMDGPCSGLEMICRPRERGSGRSRAEEIGKPEDLG